MIQSVGNVPSGERMKYRISSDENAYRLHGQCTYTLHLNHAIPACKFWSVIVNDFEKGLMICTDQSWPSKHSNFKKLIVNSEGSVDILFVSKIRDSKDFNWTKTIPGLRWRMIMHLYV